MTNARQKGHAYERKLATELREFYPDCKTSRYESRALDDAKVDLTNTPPFSIQAKAVERGCDWFSLILKEMPKDENMNICMWKRNNKGELAIMSKESFYKIIALLQDK